MTPRAKISKSLAHDATAHLPGQCPPMLRAWEPLDGGMCAHCERPVFDVGFNVTMVRRVGWSKYLVPYHGECAAALIEGTREKGEGDE